MSGYIGGLLDRTFGAAPLLQPRTPSMFEPVAAPEPLVEPPPEIHETTRIVEAPPREHIVTNVVREEVPVVREVETTSGLRQRQLPLSLPDEAPPPEPEKVRAATGVAALQTKTITRSSVEERETIIALPEPPPRILRETRIAASPSLQPVALPPLRIPVTPQVEREVSTPSEAAEPTIKVTIGRVDVRAVVRNEPRPPTREPQAPRVTLDDYLRQRDGGKR